MNVTYGLCHGQGVDAGGEPVSNLASYAKQHTAPGADSVRHMGVALAEMSRRVFAVLKEEGLLSGETLAEGAFSTVQVRDYDGDNNAFTALHTDTVVDTEDNGNPMKEINHVRHPGRACPAAPRLPAPSSHAHCPWTVRN